MIPYLWDNIFICFKKPDHYPRWQYIFLVVDSNSLMLWLYGPIMLTSISIVFYLSAEFEKNHMDIHTLMLMGIGGYTNVSVPFQKYCERTTSRFISSYMLVTVMMDMLLYNTYFFDVLMNQRYPPKIKTLNESMHLNYSIISPWELLVCN